MYKQLFTAYGLLTLLITLGSCSSDETLAQDHTAITFEAGVARRVMNTTWDAGDKIGIFLGKKGGGRCAFGHGGGGGKAAPNTKKGKRALSATRGRR